MGEATILAKLVAMNLSLQFLRSEMRSNDLNHLDTTDQCSHFHFYFHGHQSLLSNFDQLLNPILLTQGLEFHPILLYLRLHTSLIAANAQESCDAF